MTYYVSSWTLNPTHSLTHTMANSRQVAYMLVRNISSYRPVLRSREPTVDRARLLLLDKFLLSEPFLTTIALELLLC